MEILLPKPIKVTEKDNLPIDPNLLKLFGSIVVGIVAMPGRTLAWFLRVRVGERPVDLAVSESQAQEVLKSSTES